MYHKKFLQVTLGEGYVTNILPFLEKCCFNRKKLCLIKGFLSKNLVDSSVYTNILDSHLLPHMYFGEIWQQDNAPAHILAEISTWFLNCDNEVLQNWPSNSPGLNNFENLRAILKGRLAKWHPKTLKDLETFEEFHPWGTSPNSWQICTKAFQVNKKMIDSWWK